MSIYLSYYNEAYFIDSMLHAVLFQIKTREAGFTLGESNINLNSAIFW